MNSLRRIPQSVSRGSRVKTEIVRVSERDTKENELLIRCAAEIIKGGGLVVFPTETVYGLGADATNAEAAKSIFKAKGRPSDNPLIIHLSTPEEADKYAYTSELYYKLANIYMPGPLTVIMKSRESVPIETRGGLDTVAVRCPSNPVARRLIELSGVPIAAPSANLSGSPSPTCAEHVIDDMMGRVDMIIDGGECDFGLESTIVKINDDNSITLLRPGKITAEELSLIADLTVADAVTDKLRDGERALSPGMKYRHYAPKAPVILIDADTLDSIEYIKEKRGGKYAVFCYTDELAEYREHLSDAVLYEFGNRDDELTQAHQLFSLLRLADKEQFDVIYAPSPKRTGIGLALYNRMIRAAAHRIIKLRR